MTEAQKDPGQMKPTPKPPLPASPPTPSAWCWALPVAPLASIAWCWALPVASPHGRRRDATLGPKARRPSRLPFPRLSLAPGACAVRVLLCVDEGREWPHSSRLPDGQFETLTRYTGRLGLTGFAQTIGTRLATVDKWVCWGVRPAKAVDLAAQLQLLVAHELEAAGRCGCRACVPAKNEKQDDEMSRMGWGRGRFGAPSAGSVLYGAPVWCQGTRRQFEACA